MIKKKFNLFRNYKGEYYLLDDKLKKVASSNKKDELPLINATEIKIEIKNNFFEEVNVEMESDENELFPLKDSIHINKKGFINILY